MPAHVDKRRCDGCRAAVEPACVAACPGDLMAIDPQTLSAFCRNVTDCWDCCACVKACPTGAVAPRLHYALALYGVKGFYEQRPGGCRWVFSGVEGVGTFDLPGDDGWE